MVMSLFIPALEAGTYQVEYLIINKFVMTQLMCYIYKGNKRTAEQSCDQMLTRMNKALALNCNAKLNATAGATAEDWRGGIPVRVVRNFKLAKHSKYAPEEGNRYNNNHYCYFYMF